MISIAPSGDDTLLVDFGDSPESNARVRAVFRFLHQHRPHYLSEVVAGVQTLAIVLPETWRDADHRARAQDALGLAIEQSSCMTEQLGRRVVLPVCYDASMAPDLQRVCEITGLSAKAVIERHQAAIYEAELVGFMPGFAYLGGLDATLRVPRLPTPRPAVSAGSLGITGTQCAVYPTATPGGWNLIGRCPLQLFDPHRAQPALIALGDSVQFQSISVTEFERLWGQR